jgi:site-specific recombinase XerD
MNGEDMKKQYPEASKNEMEFYDSFPADTGTRSQYRYGLRKFAAWFKHSPDEILKMRREDLKLEDAHERKRFDRELEHFYNDMRKQGASVNTARSQCSGLRQFFRYNDVPISLRRGSPIAKSQMTDRTYALNIEDARKMFNVADLRQRVMLSMAKDLGLRIGDFVQIKKADLPDLNQEPPIPFDVMTHKEGVLAKAHLSADSVDLLKTYLPTIAKNPNPYLFPSNGKGNMDTDTVGWNLKQLAKKAGLTIPAGKQLTFHAFRKLFISTGKNLNIDPDVIKAMCGKQVAQDIMTYMTTVDWRKAFSQIADVLKIQGFTAKNHAKLEDLKEQVENLTKQLADQIQINTMLASFLPEGKAAQVREIIKRQRSTVLKRKEE